MIIERSNYLKIIPENKYEESTTEHIVQNFCVHFNVEYNNKAKNNFFKKVPKYIYTYKKSKNFYYVYKGHKEVLEELKKRFDVKLIDKRVTNPIGINCNIGPRDDEQRKALKALKSNDFNYGILEAVPAAGKTYMSINMLCHYKQRTLIIVDMTLLIEQFIESLLKFTDIKEDEIGVIRGGKSEINSNHKVILATVQTLIKRKDLAKELSDSIGFLIVDEVHVSACATFQEIIPIFRPKYQLGLSGTPNRDDQKEFLIFESIGPIVYVANRKAMLDSGSMLLPILRPILLKNDNKFYKNQEEAEFRDVVEEYYLDIDAIKKISKLIKFHYFNNDYQLLICKETSMVDLYYKEILITLFEDEQLYEKALEQKQNMIKEINLKFNEDVEAVKKLHNITETRKKKIKQEGNLKEYKKNKIMILNKKYEQNLKKIEKMNWYEMPIVCENKLFETVKIIDGKLNKEKRDRIINDTNDGKVKIVISTTVTDKAISISRLNVLYLLFSTRERANTTQRVG